MSLMVFFLKKNSRLLHHPVRAAGENICPPPLPSLWVLLPMGGGGLSSGDSKGMGGSPVLPPWLNDTLASNLSPSSPCSQEMKKSRASQWASIQLCSILLDHLAVKLAQGTGKGGGCPTPTWQQAGGRAPTHTHPSCPLPYWVAPMVKLALNSSPGTLYGLPHPPPPTWWPWRW